MQKNGVMTQMSVCQSETEKHARLTIIWYCQSEWVKIFKEIWVILMFLDWQNVQWTANYMLVIRTGNTSKVFNMTVCVSVIIFTITITVLTTCWMAVGWGPVEPPELKASQHLRSWNRSFGRNALIWLTCVKCKQRWKPRGWKLMKRLIFATENLIRRFPSVGQYT